MKKSLMLATVAILLTLVLAACSGAGGSNGVTPGAPGIGGTSTPGIGPGTTPLPGTGTPIAPGSGGSSP